VLLKQLKLDSNYLFPDVSIEGETMTLSLAQN